MTAEDARLRPGDTCWRTANAERAAPIMDNADYLAALRSALQGARRSVLILGWTFDPRTVLVPDAQGRGEPIGQLLLRLAEERSELEIRILAWRMALPIAAGMGFYPHRAKGWFRGTRVDFRMEKAWAAGACHHQKLVVIDDVIAFCGGGDISVDRWDSHHHHARDPRRTMPGGREHPPRHEMMLVVSGDAAAMLAAHGRERWREATGETLDATTHVEDDPWPKGVEPMLRGVQAAVSRTEPTHQGHASVAEIERLHMAAIGSARFLIYLENQYVASPLIETALARRLQEPDGPEVVLVTTWNSPSWFDQMTMDQTRSALIGRLRAADVFGRFRAYCPLTAGGRGIIVHCKVSVIDDELLRIGSANLNNRSFGFDTELDLTLAVDTEADRARIGAFRIGLIAHWLGLAPEDVEVAVEAAGGRLVEALDVLTADNPRLTPVPPYKQGRLRNLIALHHLGDPVGCHDSWKPWKRVATLRRRVLELAPPVAGR